MWIVFLLLCCEQLMYVTYVVLTSTRVQVRLKVSTWILVTVVKGPVPLGHLNLSPSTRPNLPWVSDTWTCPPVRVPVFRECCVPETRRCWRGATGSHGRTVSDTPSAPRVPWHLGSPRAQMCERSVRGLDAVKFYKTIQYSFLLTTSWSFSHECLLNVS